MYLFLINTTELEKSKMIHTVYTILFFILYIIVIICITILIYLFFIIGQRQHTSPNYSRR